MSGTHCRVWLCQGTEHYVILLCSFHHLIMHSFFQRTWRRFAQDNLIWRDLFKRRKCDGWDIDLRRITTHLPNKPQWIPLDWHELYKTRAELDRRWSPNPTVFTNFNSEDKENISLWGPKVQRLSGHMDRYISFLSIFSFPFLPLS